MNGQFLSCREAAEQNPGLVTDVFGLFKVYLKHNRALFYECAHLESIITLAIALIGVDDERAAASHSNFMIELQKSLQDDLLGIEEG